MTDEEIEKHFDQKAKDALARCASSVKEVPAKKLWILPIAKAQKQIVFADSGLYKDICLQVEAGKSGKPDFCNLIYTDATTNKEVSVFSGAVVPPALCVLLNNSEPLVAEDENDQYYKIAMDILTNFQPQP